MTKDIDTAKLDYIQFTLNDMLFLDTLDMGIRGKTISYSFFKKLPNRANDGRRYT